MFDSGYQLGAYSEPYSKKGTDLFCCAKSCSPLKIDPSPFFRQEPQPEPKPEPEPKPKPEPEPQPEPEEGTVVDRLQELTEEWDMEKVIPAAALVLIVVLILSMTAMEGMAPDFTAPQFVEEEMLPIETGAAAETAPQ